MIAFDKQHLGNLLPVVIQILGVIHDILAFRSRKRAGGTDSAVDFDRAQFAAAVRRIIGIMAQMRNIDASRCGRFHNGLPVFKRDRFAVDGQGFSHINRLSESNVRLHHCGWPCGERFPVRRPDRNRVRN